MEEFLYSFSPYTVWWHSLLLLGLAATCWWCAGVNALFVKNADHMRWINGNSPSRIAARGRPGNPAETDIYFPERYEYPRAGGVIILRTVGLVFGVLGSTGIIVSLARTFF